jgi:hypothetical protein
MLAAPDDDLVVSVTGKVLDNYTLELKEPDKEVNELLARYYPADDDAVDIMTADPFTAEERQASGRTLKAAVVKAHYTDDISFMDNFGNGWVCSCDHWMCMNCPPSRKPQKGNYYLYKGRMARYMGYPGDEDEIRPYARKIQPLSLPREFPKTKEYINSPDNELYSTLYFDSLVRLDKNGKADISFYTNDLKGKFYINVQGMVNGAPVSSKADFKVE